MGVTLKMKYIRSAVLVSFGLLMIFGGAIAAQAEVPEPFRGYDDKSRYKLNYDNLTAALEVVVADVGRSDRKKAPRTEATTGTRMRVKINRSTINEGNRFYFETFVDNEESKQQLESIKDGIEQATSQVPLARLSRDEQLAYWLNLYNITVVNEIVKIYPQSNLENLLYGRKSILEKKLLTVEGVSLSLNDIQFTILKENYGSNPMVIYGLYQGIIGSPNIRRSAYTGANVHQALAENAVVFVNSNRGTAIKNEKVFRVSSFYERNAVYFPNFDADLSAHLLNYLEGDEQAALQVATRLKSDIDDWTVTDLGGSAREIGGSMALSNAALMGAVSGASSSNYGGKATASSGSALSINSALARQVQENKESDPETDEDEEESSEEPDSASEDK